MRSSRVSLVMLCGLLATVAVHGQEPDPPPFYAIRNVTVVSPGADPIEGATVLLASHEQDRASVTGTRRVVVAGGTVVDAGLASPDGTEAARVG